MDEKLSGIVTAVGASEGFPLASGSFGTVVYDGIRMTLDDGTVAWLPKVVAAGRTSFLMEEAMFDGAPVEVWLSGPADFRLAYAVRTPTESYYDTAGIPSDVAMIALRHFLIGLATLVLLLGIPVLLYSAFVALRAWRLRPSNGRGMFDEQAPTAPVARVRDEREVLVTP